MWANESVTTASSALAQWRSARTRSGQDVVDWGRYHLQVIGYNFVVVHGNLHSIHTVTVYINLQTFSLFFSLQCISNAPHFELVAFKILNFKLFLVVSLAFVKLLHQKTNSGFLLAWIKSVINVDIVSYVSGKYLHEIFTES